MLKQQFTKYFVKKFGDVLPQSSAQKLHETYKAVCNAARKVPRYPIWAVGAKNTDPSKGFVALKDNMNQYFSQNAIFGAEIPKGFELVRTLHFPFHPETGRPLQEDLIVKTGQKLELSPFAFVCRNPRTKELYMFFKGTVPWTKEFLASTGTNKVGFNNDDVVPASLLIKGMPGVAKGSNARWMLARVYYIDEGGNKQVLVESMVDQMDECAQPEFMKGYKATLVAHSVGTTELAIMYTKISLAKVQPVSSLALCIGPYRIYSKHAVDWMNDTATGPWINLVNGSDLITMASSITGTIGTTYLTRPEITDKVIEDWVKENPFEVPGQIFGFESRHGVGYSPDTNHSLGTYGLSFKPENFDFIERLVQGMAGLLRFKAESGKDILSIQPLSQKEMDEIAAQNLDYDGFWYSQYS